MSYPMGKLCISIPVESHTYDIPENLSSNPPVMPAIPSLLFKENSNESENFPFDDQSMVSTSTTANTLPSNSEFLEMDSISPSETYFLEDSEDFLASYSSSMSPNYGNEPTLTSEIESSGLLPTPLPNITESEALSFRLEVEDVLVNISSRVRAAYRVVSSLDSNDSCPFGEQLRDTCRRASCEMGGVSDEMQSCGNILGECQPRQGEEGNSVYAAVDLDDLLRACNYSLNGLQQCGGEVCVLYYLGS